ncbi:hypothetical protein [Streptomyces chiangmaiensis]|uniref:Uncharacterized protein n=1 Tax=Streptomyces chiangmaiensis TaxID=766497 RepID=A0ABU7FLC9_9ACTN|nr:hypothetical protein [Streptomyces chiangmaiensis]MED7824497.1 hypothetical protein [Streptomyces chiangmaiensis]
MNSRSPLARTVCGPRLRGTGREQILGRVREFLDDSLGRPALADS